MYRRMLALMGNLWFFRRRSKGLLTRRFHSFGKLYLINLFIFYRNWFGFWWVLLRPLHWLMSRLSFMCLWRFILKFFHRVSFRLFCFLNLHADCLFLMLLSVSFWRLCFFYLHADNLFLILFWSSVLCYTWLNFRLYLTFICQIIIFYIFIYRNLFLLWWWFYYNLFNLAVLFDRFLNARFMVTSFLFANWFSWWWHKLVGLNLIQMSFHLFFCFRLSLRTRSNKLFLFWFDPLYFCIFNQLHILFDL